MRPIDGAKLEEILEKWLKECEFSEPDGNVEAQAVYACICELHNMPTLDVAPVAEHTRMRRALAMMWYAYRNKDEEFPHDFERKAEKMAEKLLGKWEECMPELLREENNGIS